MKYYTLKAGYHHHPSDLWWDDNRPNGVTVFEPDEPHVASGILNSDGEMLYRAAMQPIGFIRRGDE